MSNGLDKEEVEDDFKFSRDQYYKLVEKGDEAINIMMDLARESEHPRAFEVLATMIKTNAEIADRLMDLQRKKRDTLATPEKGVQPTLPGVTHNNLFVGSTKELAKMIEERSAVRQVKDIDENE